ncbi:MAG: hypothetical protein KR126chlam1_00384 [Chlamydiae bacterium]|nr:hypothetical protein [Chlamydiota bacterium]
MSTTIKNMLVGIFILGAISLVVAIILFLKPSVGDGKQVLFVRFSDIGNISVGTRVLFAGKPIGEVASVKEIRDAREQPTDELGRVYFFQVTLHIDSHFKVYNTDEISISTSGLLGEKSISITPKAPPIGITPKQVTNQPIYANSVDMIQNAMVDFSDLSGSMEQTFDQISEWMKMHGEEVATTVRATGAALKQIDQAVSTCNRLGVIHNVQDGAKQLATTLGQIQTAMHELEENNTFADAAITIKNLKAASCAVETICNDVIEAKGTLGKLVVDNDLYLRTNSLLSKVNNLMNDVNHYGLLFHLNKEWQRTHLQKISELNALSTPTTFRSYFQKEVDDINLSMSRISMLINKAENSPVKEKIFASSAFKKDFTELMRRANELSDNLRLYNQQLNEATED